MVFIEGSEASVPAMLGALDEGGTVKTEVYDPEASKAAGPVYLEGPEDVQCSGCGTRIGPDEYPGAGWANILGRLKLQYGHTVCAECHGALA